MGQPTVLRIHTLRSSVSTPYGPQTASFRTPIRPILHARSHDHSMQTHDHAMLFLDVFHPNSPPQFTIATFCIKAYGVDSNDAAIAIIQERLRPGMQLLHHIDATFKVEGTSIAIFDVMAFVMIDRAMTIEDIHFLCKEIAAERPIVGATYMRGWSVGLVPPAPAVNIARVSGSLTDTEVRTLEIQHPHIQTRAWFGQDEEGRAILRTAIVGSAEEIAARSPPESDEDEPAGSESGAEGGASSVP